MAGLVPDPRTSDWYPLDALPGNVEEDLLAALTSARDQIFGALQVVDAQKFLVRVPFRWTDGGLQLDFAVDHPDLWVGGSVSAWATTGALSSVFQTNHDCRFNLTAVSKMTHTNIAVFTDGSSGVIVPTAPDPDHRLALPPVFVFRAIADGLAPAATPQFPPLTPPRG